MSAVFVTGHRGLLGSALLRVLRDAGMRVHTYDGDIRDASAVMTFVSGLDAVDVVIHSAAAIDVNRCEKEKEWCTSVNVEGTRNVMNAAASRGARFFYISTVMVFSGAEGDYREDDRPDPKNHYSVTKVRGEEIALTYERSLILRLNLIGIHPDGSRGKNFMEWLVDSLRRNTDMKLFRDIRINPLSNWTLAEIIRDFMIDPPHEKVLHLATHDVLSKADIGRMVLAHFPEYTGKVEYVTSDALSAAAFRPKEMWLNADKAERLGLTLPTVKSEVERILKNA